MLCYGEALPIVRRQIRIESDCLLTPNMQSAEFSACVVFLAPSQRKKWPIDIGLTPVAPRTPAKGAVTIEEFMQIFKTNNSVGFHQSAPKQFLPVL